MKLVTWNVNSIRQRLPRLLAMLGRHEPDVVCLQETKVEDAAFPTMEIAAAGYEGRDAGAAWVQRGRGRLSKGGMQDVALGFEGDPVPERSRVLAATVGDLRVICVYVVNGKEVGDPAYETKLTWLDALRASVTASNEPSRPLVICGDWNVAPDDRDVWDPDLWRGKNLASEPERERVRAFLAWGLTDLGRRAAGDVQGPFAYWDYTAGAFHKGWGLRIDLALGTAPVADRLASVVVERDERRPTFGEGKPSDRPVIVTLDG